jgi:hypothetical protein
MTGVAHPLATVIGDGSLTRRNGHGRSRLGVVEHSVMARLGTRRLLGRRLGAGRSGSRFGTRRVGGRRGAPGVAAAVSVLGALVVGVIVLGILLVVLGANQANILVDIILDIGRWLTTPFHGLFPRPDPVQDVALNWGIAALVYAAVAAVIVRFTR